MKIGSLYQPKDKQFRKRDAGNQILFSLLLLIVFVFFLGFWIGTIIAKTW